MLKCRCAQARESFEGAGLVSMSRLGGRIQACTIFCVSFPFTMSLTVTLYGNCLTNYGHLEQDIVTEIILCKFHIFSAQNQHPIQYFTIPIFQYKVYQLTMVTFINVKSDI